MVAQTNNLKSYPVDDQGNLLHYPEPTYIVRDGHYIKSEIVWADNKPFVATLTLQTSQRGRSAAYFMWKDTATNKTYPMFMADMLDLVLQKTIVNGVVVGLWQVRKRGQNYGIALAPNAD